MGIRCMEQTGHVMWNIYMFFLFCLCSNCKWIHVIFSPIFFRVTSLALGQSYDCPSVSEATLKNMGNIPRILDKLQAVCNTWDMLYMGPFNLLKCSYHCTITILSLYEHTLGSSYNLGSISLMFFSITIPSQVRLFCKFYKNFLLL